MWITISQEAAAARHGGAPLIAAAGVGCNRCERI